MKLFFTFLFSCSFYFTFSQIYTSSCTPTAQMIELYRTDAYKSATVRLVRINSTYRDSIDIPSTYRDSAAKIFYAIHDMSASSIKDTILNLFGFTNFASFPPHEADSLHFSIAEPPTNINSVSIRNISVKTVEMYVSNTIPWANQWATGNYNNTSEPRVNQLVNQYQLTITTATSLPGTLYFKASAFVPINTLGLARRFNEILNSTTACTPFHYFGDGNSAGLEYETDGVKITYRNGCGDCISGCLYERKWTFKVYWANCSVEYLGATNAGFPLPPGSTVYTCSRGPIVFPVTFSAVAGFLQSGKAAINWKVLTQVNVKEYKVERSDNGHQFYTTVITPATTALTADYTWRDAALLNGTAWFRIKAVDLDGKEKYSSILKISSAAKGDAFKVYPNPVNNRTFTMLFGTSVAGQMQAGLYSIDGRKVWTAKLTLTLQTGGRTLTLPANIQPGMYALIVAGNGADYRQTIVVGKE